MAERDLALDCRGGPWPLVPALTRCSTCLGVLPADDDGACSTCGTGTPGVVEQAWLNRVTRIPEIGYTVIDEEHNLTEEQMRAAPVAARPLTWLERFARWPNHG